MSGDSSGAERRFVSGAAPLGYARPLDGMRGGAVLMVLAVHASYITFGSFAAAVDVFFVVSGFLITTLLLEEDRRTGTIAPGTFLRRRALRLFPVMYLTLAVTLVGGLALGSTDCGGGGDRAALCRSTVLNDVAAAGSYVYHVVHPVHREVLTGGAPEIRPLVQMWSLSVEEHFYLAILVVMIIALRRRLIRPLMVALLLGWAVIGVARLGGHVGPAFAFLQRPDSIALGVALALWRSLRPAKLSEPARRRLGVAATAAAGAFAVVIGVGTTLVPARLFIPFAPHDAADAAYDSALYWPRFGFTLCAASTAVVLWCVVECPKHWTARAFSPRWLRAVGQRSYCVYVIHVPLFLLCVAALRDRAGLPDGAVIGLYVVALVISSELAHRFVERPIRRIGTTHRERTVTTHAG